MAKGGRFSDAPAVIRIILMAHAAVSYLDQATAGGCAYKAHLIYVHERTSYPVYHALAGYGSRLAAAPGVIDRNSWNICCA